MTSLPKIQSVSNPMVKHAHALTVPKKLKDSVDFLCEGFHLVSEAFRSGLKVRFVLASPRALADPGGMDILRKAGEAKTKVFEVPDKIVGYLSDTAAFQGVVAVAMKPPPQRPGSVERCVLALHQVQDPGNVGTLFRSSEAFGAEGIILTKGSCDPFNPKAVRAAMGSLFRVPYENGLDWREAMDWALGKSLLTVALLQDSGESIERIPPDKPAMLWLGSEGQGLPPELVAGCTMKVRIPMMGLVESLNVAVAGSLALFHKGFNRPVS